MMDLRAYRREQAKLADWLPWAALVAPGVVLNKDGSFQRTLCFRGPDLDSSVASELIGASVRLDNVLRRFGSGWCLHVEARRSETTAYPESDWPEALSWLIDAERAQDFEEAGGRFESAYYLTLTWLPPSEAAGRLEAALFEAGEASAKANAVDYPAALKSYIDATDNALSLMRTVFVEARFLNDDETLSYLHACVSDRAHKVSRPHTPFYLDDLLTDTPVLGGLAPKLGDEFIKIVSVRAYVSETEPGLLDALNRLGLPYRWVTRVLPLDREDGAREVERIRKRWFSKRKGILTLLREALYREEAVLLDNDATVQADDADAALQSITGEAATASFVTLTIIVSHRDEAIALERARQVRQVADGLGFVTVLETINAVEAWLGSLPGQPYADMRRPILLSPNLAHVLPLSAVWAGETDNKHLGGPPLLIAATDGATPFRLNLHHGDVGHTLVVGPTGAGKSVLLGLLCAQWRRYARSQVIIFDSGRSSRALTLGLGGAFVDLLDEEHASVSLQPLVGIDDPHERAWARDWLTAIVTRAGLTLDPQRREELWRALGVLSERPASERTLSVFSALVQDAEIRLALTPFTHAGPWGRLLDADQQVLDGRDVLAFEMGELMSRPDALAAVLPCLVHLLETRFDGRPTLLVLDEAWAYLRDRQFADQVQAWLKTLRKRNVAVVFATQELADVEASTVAATVFEACPTRIFLANDRAREPRTAAFYESLGLNRRQIALIAEALPKRDYYVQTRAGARRIDLTLGPAALAFLGASTPDHQAAIDKLLLTEGAQRFAHAWLMRSGLDHAAEAIARFEDMSSASEPQAELAFAETQNGRIT